LENEDRRRESVIEIRKRDEQRSQKRNPQTTLTSLQGRYSKKGILARRYNYTKKNKKKKKNPKDPETKKNPRYSLPLKLGGKKKKY